METGKHSQKTWFKIGHVAYNKGKTGFHPKPYKRTEEDKEKRRKFWGTPEKKKEMSDILNRLYKEGEIKDKIQININKEELINNYINKNKSTKQCAEIFGCSVKYIRKKLKSYGIKLIHKHNIGRKNPCLSKTLKRLHAEGKIKIWNKNLTKETDERLRRVSEKLRGSEKLKEIRARQIFPMKDTKIEVKIQNFLKQLGVEHFTHFQISEIQHKYRCDIFIPSSKTIIECDGDYWHGNTKRFPNLNELQLKQIEEDKIRTKELQEKGFRVIRLWECEINEMDLDYFQDKLIK